MLLSVEKMIQKSIFHHINLDDVFVFLFGSRAEETAEPTSDYDVGLYADKKIPLSKIALMKDELENWPIPVDVDIVDFHDASNSFKKIALRKIVLWNKPKKKNFTLK